MNKNKPEETASNHHFQIDEYGRHEVVDPTVLNEIVGGDGMLDLMPETLSNGACINASC